MSRFKWWRKWCGGCWIYFHFIGWIKMDTESWERHYRETRQFLTNPMMEYWR